MLLEGLAKFILDYLVYKLLCWHTSYLSLFIGKLLSCFVALGFSTGGLCIEDMASSIASKRSDNGGCLSKRRWMSGSVGGLHVLLLNFSKTAFKLGPFPSRAANRSAANSFF